MSDERLRQLERAAAAGDPEAQAQLGAARRRSLDLEAVSELLRDDPEQTLKALLRPLDADELRRVQECVSREAQRREHPPREHIRLRPSVYVGDTFEIGLHNMLFGAVSASVDAAIAGSVSRLEVTLDGSMATIWDDLPRAPGLLEQDLTEFEEHEPRYLYCSSKFQFGPALFAANALSTRFDAEIVSPNADPARLSFEAGQRIQRDVAVSAPPGTRLSLQADPSVFRTTLFSFDRTRARIQEIAYLLPGLRCSLEDVRAGRRVSFETRGLVDCVGDMCPIEEALTPTFVCAGASDVPSSGGEVRIEAALTWRRSSMDEVLVGYLNTHPDRGIHLSGLREALGHAVPSGGLRGVTGALSVLVPRPNYRGGNGSTLLPPDPALGAAVRAVVEPALRTWLDDHPQAAEALRGR